jgi:dTDP-glucose 4,6-dehydratase
MRVLVTGGAGFIGSAVCRRLVSQGIAVVNVDKLTYAANLESLAPIANHSGYAFERVDICERAALQAVFAKHQPTAVIHLAAESHVDRSIAGAAPFINTNILGTYHLLETALDYFRRLRPPAREHFKFVHVSTDEVYGALDQRGRFVEDSPYRPSSPYAASKAASDHLVQAWHRTYGLPVVLSNCSNNYGPYQFPEKLIPLTILHALEGRALPVYGDGSHVRDWIYVDDHVDGLLAVLARGRTGEKYNFGADSERTNLQVVHAICDRVDQLMPQALKRRALVTFVTDRPGHDYRYALDAAKAHNELGWRPRETFDGGLERTVRWYLENRSWWGPIRRSVYAGARLGLTEPAK